MAKASHYRNLWKNRNDPSRCDRPVPLIATAPTAAQHDPVVAVTAPAVVGLHELTRRPACSVQTERDQRSNYIIRQRQLGTGRPARVRDMLYIQNQYDTYRRNITSLCSPEFWKFFLSLHTCTAAAIDAALLAARRIFLEPKSEPWNMFPPSKRALFTKIRKVPQFWEHVMHTIQIDVSAFALPSRLTKIVFEFIDPIWGWIVAARRQKPVDLHWKSVHQGVVPEFGGGVQYGKAFRQACMSCPPDSYPMCVCLHWDGTHGHGLQAAPICIGVANTNRQRSDAQFCIGYMPATPDANKLTQVLLFVCTCVSSREYLC